MNIEHGAYQTLNAYTDHEGFSYACYADPGFYKSERHCIFGKDSYSYVFEYAKQFWDLYKDQNKMFYISLIDGHEGTGQIVRFVDDPILELLQSIDSSNTTVIYISDHGLHINPILTVISETSYITEQSLPAFFVSFEKDINLSET